MKTRSEERSIEEEQHGREGRGSCRASVREEDVRDEAEL